MKSRAEGEEMTSLDEKIAVLFRKAHQFPPTRSRRLPLTARLPKKLRLKLL